MISTIDSESMSRSSVKVLSSCTSSAGTPVISLTTSARPLRISSVLATVGLLLLGRDWCRITVRPGHGGAADRSRHAGHLCRIDQPGPEPDHQGEVAAVRGSL